MFSSRDNPDDSALKDFRADLELIRRLESDLKTSIAREAIHVAIVACEKHAERVRSLEDRKKTQLEKEAVPSVDSSMTSGQYQAFRRWNVNIFIPESSFEAVVLGTHSILLGYEFVCLEELKSTTPGFAPPIRELPPSKFIPESWKNSFRAVDPRIVLMYKHNPSKKRFTLSFTFVPSSGTLILVTLSEKNNESHTVTIDTERHISLSSFSDSNPESIFTNLLGFENIIRELAAKFGIQPSELKNIKIEDIVDGMQTGSDTSYSKLTNSDRGDKVLTYTDTNLGNALPDSRVGTGDLNPFNPIASGVRRGFDNGSGSLVGPNHPIFNLPSPDRDPGYAGLPQPRFDPYGPVTGPNGPDVGNVGFDPRIPSIGSRDGPGQHRVPGEPDPDHLKPPDIPDLNGALSPFVFPGRGLGPRGRGPRDNNPFFR